MTGDFYQRFASDQAYRPPAGVSLVKTIEMHTGGEPLRVVTDGYPGFTENSLLDYRRTLARDYDHLRTALMFEPRGHADMYGCLLLPPFRADADCSAIFMHNEGYSTMCGHAVIAIMTLATEMGWVDVVDGKASLNIEAPCGLIRARSSVAKGKISSAFECVPSFVVDLEETIFIASCAAEVSYDLAYGGAFYAYVDARPLAIELVAKNVRQLIDVGSEIKHAVAAQNPNIVHPFEPDLGFLYGTIFIGDPVASGNDSRNVCVFADGEVDRSPTGSGVSGRLAIAYARGELRRGESITVESIVGSVFTGSVVRAEDYGPHKAIIPCVEGTASVVGTSEWVLNPDDEMRDGFLLR